MPRVTLTPSHKLRHLERVPCDQCQIAYINGIRCHETGCPEAWRDSLAACFECGCSFKPDHRHQRVCDDCANPEPDYADSEDTAFYLSE